MTKNTGTTKKKLLNKKKFGKYSVYAIGEIILVVIGILIALSINNWNQKRTERAKAKEYISSLIEDANTDLVNIDEVIELTKGRIINLDSLADNSYRYNAKKNQDAGYIIWYMKCLRHPDIVTQTDRTISQLKNSGGMRLLRDKSKIDAIIKYEKSFGQLYNQQLWLEEGLKDLVNVGVTVFNYKYLPKGTGKFDVEKFKRTAHLLRTDEKILVEIGNRASILSLITLAYQQFLEKGKKECLELIYILEGKKKKK